MPTLYIVATPIGNLSDISDRALSTLKHVDLIFVEDTRVARKLLNHFGIKTQVKRYNEHSPRKSFEKAENVLRGDGSVAVTSDAGTPGISDPGGKLVEFVRDNFPNVNIRVVPGPSAVISALSVSGMPANEFTFLGYPPAKKKRKKFFERVRNIEARPVVLYESTHRLQKTLNELQEVIGDDKKVFIAKEMTKIYEDYFFGSIKEALSYFVGDKLRGEFVIIIK